MSSESVAPVVHHSKRERILAAKEKLASQPRLAVTHTASMRPRAVQPANAPQRVLGSHATPGLPIVGFAEGTMILCKVGDAEQQVAVQDLRTGSLVKTSKGDFVAVNIVGSRAVVIPDSGAERSADRLYTLSKDKFPSLTQDLTVSGRRAILVDSASDADKRSMIATMGRISVVDKKYCMPSCAIADTVLSSTVGSTTLYNFSLDSQDLRTVYGVYANGLLVDHSPTYLMMSTMYNRLQ